MVYFPDSTNASPCAEASPEHDNTFLQILLNVFSLFSAINWDRLWPLSRRVSFEQQVWLWRVWRLKTRDSLQRWRLTAVTLRRNQ